MGTTLRWTRITDGTGYVYWDAPGFSIETKPRFRPACPYELRMVARPGERIDSWPIPFDKLADAKAAAELPLEALREKQRIAFENYKALWARMNRKSLDESIHEDAITEDAMRTHAAASKAAMAA